jgi:hypothetical protein
VGAPPSFFTLGVITNCFSIELATATSSLSRSSCIFHQILFEAESLLRAAAGANAVRTSATLLDQPPPLGVDGWGILHYNTRRASLQF